MVIDLNQVVNDFAAGQLAAVSFASALSSAGDSVCQMPTEDCSGADAEEEEEGVYCFAHGTRNCQRFRCRRDVADDRDFDLMAKDGEI